MKVNRIKLRAIKTFEEKTIAFHLLQDKETLLKLEFPFITAQNLLNSLYA